MAVKKNLKKALEPVDKVVINPEIPDNQNGSSPVSPDNNPTYAVENVSFRGRLKRASNARKNHSRMERGARLWLHRVADSGHIDSRAGRKARQTFRHRLAGSRGDKYSVLSTGEKIHVDSLLDPRVKLIRKLAKRLIPSVRRADAARLRTFMTGVREETEVNELSTELLQRYQRKAIMRARRGHPRGTQHNGLQHFFRSRDKIVNNGVKAYVQAQKIYDKAHR
jgi:hypothetical protein